MQENEERVIRFKSKETTIIILLVIVYVLSLCYFIQREEMKLILNRESAVKSMDETNNIWTKEFKVTYYTLHHSECGKRPGQKGYGITRSGRYAKAGTTIAVDPRVVPLGSIMIDKETGHIYTAEDTGNKVKGYKVDIFVGEGTKQNRNNAMAMSGHKIKFTVIEQGDKE